MIRSLAVVREAAAQVAQVAERALEALREGRVEQEPGVTERMLGGIEESVRQFTIKGVRWTAKTLTDRGRGAQESQHGADFAGVLSVDLPDFKVNKGFLAQAKLIEPKATVSRGEYSRMQRQCERMLERTPDSFIFLYHNSAITVVPAGSVVSSSPRNPHEFYSRSVERFFRDHFESFIGDRRLSAPTPQMLQDLQRELDTRTLLFIEARGQ